MASLYHGWWGVECLFNALKKGQKIGTFPGTAPNDIKTPVWTGLLSMLMRRFMQLKSPWIRSLSNLVAPPRMWLFTNRDLWVWFDSPLGMPPDRRALQLATLTF